MVFVVGGLLWQMARIAAPRKLRRRRIKAVASQVEISELDMGSVMPLVEGKRSKSTSNSLKPANRRRSCEPRRSWRLGFGVSRVFGTSQSTADTRGCSGSQHDVLVHRGIYLRQRCGPLRHEARQRKEVGAPAVSDVKRCPLQNHCRSRKLALALGTQDAAKSRPLRYLPGSPRRGRTRRTPSYWRSGRQSRIVLRPQ